MKSFLKENWFKLGVLFCIFIIAISVSVMLVRSVSDGNVSVQPTDRNQEVVMATTSANTGFTPISKQPVVEESVAKKVATKFDWTIPVAILPTMNDTLETYKSGYHAIETTMQNEKDIQDKIYVQLGKTQDPKMKNSLLQLLAYSKTYTDSGSNLLTWLGTAIKYYERLIAAINTRDEQQYLINSGFIEKHEAEKEKIMSDYQTKEKAKQDFAASMI